MTADPGVANQQPRASADAAVETPAGHDRSIVLTVHFATTALLGAGVLFVIQPLIAHIMLAEFGGSSTVWSTCSLFFEFVLLLAYMYVHEATRRLSRCMW